MAKKVIKVGIMSREDYKKRTIEIARGKHKPKKGEPKIWFESLQSMAQVLSEMPSPPDHAAVTGRKRSNLSRTLKTMSRYGIVDLVKQNRSVMPIVKATDFRVEFGLNTS